MNIYINDEITPEERRSILRYYPIKYALEKFKGNRTKSCRFLGISIRALRNIINENRPYFNNFLPSNSEDIESLSLKLLSEENCLSFADEVEKLEKRRGWQFLDDKRKKSIIRKVFLRYLGDI